MSLQLIAMISYDQTLSGLPRSTLHNPNTVRTAERKERSFQ